MFFGLGSSEYIRELESRAGDVVGEYDPFHLSVTSFTWLIN